MALYAMVHNRKCKIIFFCINCVPVHGFWAQKKIAVILIEADNTDF